jgi:uncharacterized membrane protein
MSTPRGSTALWATLAAACWGFGIVATKALVREIPPLTLGVLQVAGGTALAWGLVVWRGRSAGGAHASGWPGIFEPGLSDLAGPVGLVAASASAATLVMASEPVLVAILAWLALGERLPAIVEEQLRETDDGVHRRAQLVAHRRQELGLGAAGLGLPRMGGLQFAGEAGLLVDAPVEVDQQRAGGGERFEPGQQLGIHLVAGVGDGVHADHLPLVDDRHAEVVEERRMAVGEAGAAGFAAEVVGHHHAPSAGASRRSRTGR